MLQPSVSLRCRLVPLIIDTHQSDCASTRHFYFSCYWVKNSPSCNMPYEAENGNVCICGNPPAGGTEAVCREIFVLSTPPFQVEDAPISLYKCIITAGWIQRGIKSLNLWLACLWLYPAAHLTIHHAAYPHSSVQLRMSSIRG